MKKVIITSKNISPKQWSVLLLELNMIKQQWKPYADIKINTPGINKIISWGKRRYDTREDKRGRKSVEQN
tara:strand:- start:118 stop:327 length:210 start_codon:yes stop_codon:yes gene_type:complete